MRMSEPKPPHAIGLRAPALALARWTTLLMGWVWLGAQGQRLGWSLAGGVLAVALWWALRLVLARLHWQAPAPPTRLALGMLTAAGAGTVARLDGGQASFWALVVLATLWAAWSVALDTTAANAAHCQRPWVGWPPVAAALITWAVLGVPVVHPLTGVPVSLVLLGAALLACGSPPARRAPPRGEPLAMTAASSLPHTAMGLMMGSLWLGSAWCVSAGWSMQAVVGLHLLLMAALAGLIPLGEMPRQLSPLTRRALPLVLVLVGALLMCAGQKPAHHLVGMLLLALAWAWPMQPAAFVGQTMHWPALRWAPLGGPLLLVTVGIWSPSLGPQALALAYGGLGALAGIVLLVTLAGRVAQPFGSNRVQTPCAEDAK